VNGMRDVRERQARVRELLELVQLPAAFINRFPHAFSGGQRQRIGIARALALQPELIICDEPVSALDVSVRAQVLHLLLGLRRARGLALLLITHDIGLAWSLCDRIAVMYLGRVVELGSAADVLERPQHPYTQALIAVAPSTRPRPASRAAILEGEAPDASRLPSGCRFHPRCPRARERCAEEDVAPRPSGAPGQTAACWYPGIEGPVRVAVHPA
jgi:oligopeptide transport system ATP-binding protein